MERGKMGRGMECEMKDRKMGCMGHGMGNMGYLGYWDMNEIQDTRTQDMMTSPYSCISHNR